MWSKNKWTLETWGQCLNLLNQQIKQMHAAILCDNRIGSWEKGSPAMIHCYLLLFEIRSLTTPVVILVYIPSGENSTNGQLSTNIIFSPPVVSLCRRNDRRYPANPRTCDRGASGNFDRNTCSGVSSQCEKLLPTLTTRTLLRRGINNNFSRGCIRYFIPFLC